jgi:primosomal protein N' (replication factor Y)
MHSEPLALSEPVPSTQAQSAQTPRSLSGDDAQQPSSVTFVEVALPVPLRKTFDYRLPSGLSSVTPGTRVQVPFGRQQKVGIVVRVKGSTQWPQADLKTVLTTLDEQPAVSAIFLVLGQWIARYYHQPIGEVMALMLPPALRKGKRLTPPPEDWVLLLQPHWQPRANARKQLKLKARFEQAAAAEASASTAPIAVSVADLKADGWGLAQLKPFVQQGVLAFEQRQPMKKTQLSSEALAADLQQMTSGVPQQAPVEIQLNQAQTQILEHLQQASGFQCALLEGVTGSGKTLVYIAWLRSVLAQGKQALVMIPEIGLTSQTLERFQAYFGQSVAYMHSGLSEGQRLKLWQACQTDQVKIVIGTRSALFTPFKCLGAIIVDEEHDACFRQQDQVRYSARDAAIKYAQLLDIPVLLGSATPSLESLFNAQKGRYQHYQLMERATAMPLPEIRLQDVRHLPDVGGIALPLIKEMQQRLEAGEQVMVFLNRRGYAPTLYCHDCGWIAQCRQCDAALTLHRSPHELRCHHCDARAQPLWQCPQCLSAQLGPLGQGTERIEEALASNMNYPVLRIDRDTTHKRAQWEQHLARIASGEPMVILGTQMLAKGHHFPKLNWVLIVDMDAMLFSADERAYERAAQLFYQVAGRSGREASPQQRAGQVIIQSRFPDHAWIKQLATQSYAEIAQQLLAQRAQRLRAPVGFAAMIRADSPKPMQALNWLEKASKLSGVNLVLAQVLGPEPAPMELRQGRFRAQWHFTFQERSLLHQNLERFERWAQTESISKLRWSIEVDPVDLL